MPYKCLECDVVSATQEPACACDNPQMVECVTVHYLTVHGKGEVMARMQRSNTGISKAPALREVNPNEIPIQREEKVALRIACGNPSGEKHPIATTRIEAVTCIACLDATPEEDTISSIP